MPLNGSVLLRLLAGLALPAAILISIPARTQAHSPDAPTASQPAESLTEAWQRATAKYQPAREAILRQVDRQANDGPFRPDWRSLSAYQAPEWYRDAKFGIFIHWGVYSVPAFGTEWYPRLMYKAGSPENLHHLATYGPLTSFGYKDFIPMFKAERFDPQAWAHLFKEAGARYVVPVFEHHDGFQMYDSSLSDWTAVKMGPHRDVGGELAKAVRAEGLHFGASSHRIEHDWFMDTGRSLPSDVNDPRNAGLYGPAQMQLLDGGQDDLAQDWTYVSTAYANDWLARSAEIVLKYHPEVIYFDWWIGQPYVRPYLARFAAFYYNESLKHGTIGVIDYKHVAMAEHSAVLDVERGELSDIRSTVWQTDTSLGNKSWGYIQNETFKTPGFVVRQLADIVSKNGNLLLNIGPRSDGTIPEQVQQTLLAVGGWLKTNGEAICGSRPWKIYGEGPSKARGGSFHDTDVPVYTAEDFRFTTRGGNLYAIEFAWPANGEAVIHSLGTDALKGSRVKSVSLLGSGARLTYEQRADGLHIHPGAKPAEDFAYTYRIVLE